MFFIPPVESVQWIDHFPNFENPREKVYTSPTLILKKDRSGERIQQGIKKHIMIGFCQPVFQLNKH